MILQDLAPDYIRGVSLLGGEPMEPENRGAVLSLVKKVREQYPQKTIWCYTGFTLEQLLRDGSSRELLCNIDVLVDGPFIASKRSEEALFRGSTNQRILMARESALKGEPVHWERPCWDL